MCTLEFLLNLMETGSSPAEGEEGKALPNGAKAARWVAKTALAVFAVLLGT